MGIYSYKWEYTHIYVYIYSGIWEDRKILENPVSKAINPGKRQLGY